MYYSTLKNSETRVEMYNQPSSSAEKYSKNYLNNYNFNLEVKKNQMLSTYEYTQQPISASNATRCGSYSNQKKKLLKRNNLKTFYPN